LFDLRRNVARLQDLLAGGPADTATP